MSWAPVESDGLDDAAGCGDGLQLVVLEVAARSRTDSVSPCCLPHSGPKKDSKLNFTGRFSGPAGGDPKRPQKLIFGAFYNTERPRGTSGKVPEPGGKKFILKR